ncbi:NeuD/PglB/VioB family sugar acetyltransferase [Leptospira kmetyi]|uniref:NeuD/PglB/VioB family sugar acetyltransferase n=1 Tax=Leptospira kmetyi TaxID=408139 RepID=UPI0010840E15|nr:NeuD/PglB/VioB family sugar acetyltransferase [Leptospira kmetyi]TGK21435.1 acetyltransferase [Leptospira kmetyi]TGK28362.1 acetyltransferase [Leptospira kmetyi]TGL68270.1 acetyltransferase [Leptospira kmetyi]
MSKRSLILVGAGGHFESCLEVIQEYPEIELIGVIDRDKKNRPDVDGVKILGDDDIISEFVSLGHSFLITIGQIKTPKIRMDLFRKIKSMNGLFETIFSKRSHISRNANFKSGSIVMQGCIINRGVEVGENCIVNTGAILEHGVKIGDHTHISTRAVLNGEVRVGSGSFIGSGSVVNQAVQIGDSILIGSGSIVTKDLVEPGVYWGNPAKKIR